MNLGLGQLITEPRNRDAVHVAVAPVVAGHELVPGQRVLLVNEVCVAAGAFGGVGIVDPFLQEKVNKGESFWLWMDPGSITSLRHDWTHPALDGAPEESEPQKRIRELGDQLGLTYEKVIYSAARFLDRKSVV